MMLLYITIVGDSIIDPYTTNMWNKMVNKEDIKNTCRSARKHLGRKDTWWQINAKFFLTEVGRR